MVSGEPEASPLDLELGITRGKQMHELGEYFQRLRSNKRHHLGLGDVRLTLAQQEALAEKFAALRLWIEGAGEQHDICTRHMLGRVCKNCRCGKAVRDA